MQLPVGTHFTDNICAPNEFLLTGHHSTLGAPNLPMYRILNFDDMLCDGEGEPFPSQRGKIMLAELTYALCHLFTNWSGTVPTPSVAKYATTAVKQMANINMQPSELDRFSSNIRNSDLFAKMFFI